MPRRIKVIDLENNDTVAEVEPIKYEEVVEKIDENPTEPVEVVIPSDPVVMKKTRARPSKPKKDTVIDLTPEAIEEVKPKSDTIIDLTPEVVEEVKLNVVEEVKPEVVILEPKPEDKKVENKNVKTVELVECPKCGKKLTERTLKYSHANKCPKNENKQEEPNKKVKTQHEAKPITQISEDIHPMVSAYTQRINKIKEKQEKFRNLATLAF